MQLIWRKWKILEKFLLDQCYKYKYIVNVSGHLKVRLSPVLPIQSSTTMEGL